MQKAAFGLLEIEGINGVLDFVRFRPALPTKKTPDGSEGFARGRVVLPDEQEAFAQRRLQLADIQIFSGGGNAQRGFGVRGDGLPCRRKAGALVSKSLGLLGPPGAETLYHKTRREKSRRRHAICNSFANRFSQV